MLSKLYLFEFHMQNYLGLIFWKDHFDFQKDQDETSSDSSDSDDNLGFQKDQDKIQIGSRKNFNDCSQFWAKFGCGARSGWGSLIMPPAVGPHVGVMGPWCYGAM